jgi:ankyrin repeat protein
LNPTPTAEPSDLRRPPIDFSRPLNEWDRSEVVARFNIKPNGLFEVMICAGTKVNPEDLLCLAESEVPRKICPGWERERNKLVLHLAVLSHDLRLVESLVGVGYSPNLSAQVSDRKPLCGLRTPIDIAIASHCEPITKVLLKHGAELNPAGGISPCSQLFATASLDPWPSTDLDAYMQALRELLTSGFDWRTLGCPIPMYSRSGGRISWAQFILHQICGLPEAWFHLRMPLLIFALEFYGRNWRGPSFSPLHVSIEICDLKTLKFLLETSSAQFLDAQLQRKDKKRRLPLHFAIQRLAEQRFAALDMIRTLLERGASPDAMTWELSVGFSSYNVWKEITIRDIAMRIAMRSGRADLKKLIAEY